MNRVNLPSDNNLSRKRVLVVGVYLTTQRNNIEHIVDQLSLSRHWEVEQRWAAIGGVASSRKVRDVTRLVLEDGMPRFALLNRLLADEALEGYDFILVSDDDISLPVNFLDNYLDLVLKYDFALAQPARTHTSYIGIPFITQMSGLAARRTRFVEIGPVLSIRRDIFSTLLPFDEATPMGWGCDFVWPCLIEARGCAMGVVDATPVEHSTRKPAVTYDYDEAKRAEGAFLSERAHLTRGEAFTILESFASTVRGHDRMEDRAMSVNKGLSTTGRDRSSNGNSLPLSVILCTYNRSSLLQMSLASLVDQTLDKDSFEVVVIDDGSSDNTREVAHSFGDRLPLRYFYQNNAGPSSARNHGIYAAKGNILYFLDDDDIATPKLLEEHLRTHQKYPDESYGVLNYTTWSPHLKVSPLMRFITEVGCFLFSYPHITHGSILDYTYFWGGTISCKRSFLIEHGVFNPMVRLFGCEDIELGYRLSHHGLKIVYDATAVTYVVREVVLQDFYSRLLRQGCSQYYFSTMHRDPQVAEWCEVIGADEKWRIMEPVYDAMVKSTYDLEKIAHQKLLHGLEFDSTTEKLLYQAYSWTFRATKIKGIVEAQKDDIAHK